jgi:hypothetical protein
MITVTAQPTTSTRFHPRVDAGIMVKLFTNGRAVLAKAVDLSMAGVLVLGDFSRSEERITVAVPLPNDREVVTGATVKRRSDAELALEFDQLDWDDMFALARFLNPRLP